MDQELARPSVPTNVQASLREAFASEVAKRLPRIAALIDDETSPLPTTDSQDLETALRDVHTLVSSAWVVGEPQISRLARAVEEDLTGGPVTELVALLRAWTP